VVVGVVSTYPDTHKYFLTILLWALILEIIVMAYYASKGDLGFYFQLTAFITLITALGIWATISRIRKEIKEGL